MAGLPDISIVTFAAALDAVAEQQGVNPFLDILAQAGQSLQISVVGDAPFDMTGFLDFENHRVDGPFRVFDADVDDVQLATNGYNNVGRNQIFGGEDGLNGRDGNDTLIGGSGDNTYGWQAGDVMIEQADQGYDRIFTNALYSNLHFANIEEIVV